MAATNSAQQPTPEDVSPPKSTTTRDTIIVASVLIASLSLSLISIFVLMFFRRRKDRRNAKDRMRKGSVASQQAREEAGEQQLVALRGRAESGGGSGSVIQLDDLEPPNTSTKKGKERAMSCDSPALTRSFDFARVVQSQGPLDSHPPTPQLPLSQLSNNWSAPQNWKLSSDLPRHDDEPARASGDADAISAIGVLPSRLANDGSSTRSVRTTNQSPKAVPKGIGIAH